MSTFTCCQNLRHEELQCYEYVANVGLVDGVHAQCLRPGDVYRDGRRVANVTHVEILSMCTESERSCRQNRSTRKKASVDV
jgi:hypothetical protein